MPPLLTLRDVGVTFGGEPLFAGLELALSAGDRACLVGRNGSGKSTLLKLIAGQIEADAGERFVQPGCHIAYLPQDPKLPGGTTVADYAAQGLFGAEADERHRVEVLLDELGLDGGADPASLSGGEARRADLARALVGEADILLLDEPTNHLDLSAIEWLEARLAGFRGALMVISHDRRFLARITRQTLWLDRGNLKRLDKGYDAFEAWAAQVLDKEERERHELDKLIAQETKWSHEGITARRKRNQGRLRRLQAMRQERAGWLKRAGSAALAVESDRLSGKLVAEAKEIAKAYDGRPVVAGFSTRILRGDRIGIIGPNGAGKTTLLRMLIGDLAPDSGSVRLGTNLDLAYFDQTRAQLNPDETLWETLCPGGGDQVMVRGRPRHVVTYLRDFLFDDRQARSPVSSLSGGERNRLLLAQVLAKPANLLVLDEPTNDLDIETLDLLQEMLADFDGTVLLVSHDRDFLDRVVGSTIAMGDGGHAVEYAGGYSDYLKQRPAAPATSRKTERPAGKPQKPKSASQPRARLSFKEQHALKELPGRIESLATEITALEAKLAEPDYYARDPHAFDQAAKRLVEAQAEHAAAEEEWLTLEMKREELEGG